MKSKIDYGYADDYVTMVVNDLHFYYGYEVTVEDKKKVEWCFQVSTVKRGKVGFKSEKPFFLMTTSQIRKKLPTTFLKDPRDFLIAGIGIFNEELNKKFGRLKKTTKKTKDGLTFTIANL